MSVRLLLAAAAALFFAFPLSAQMGRPPEQSIEACKGQETGAECSFAAPRGEVEGTCLEMRGVFHCVPAQRGPGMGPGMGQGMGQGKMGPGRGMGPGMGMGPGKTQGPPAEAFEVCEGKEDGAACGFESYQMGPVSGTCQTTGQGKHCVRTP